MNKLSPSVALCLTLLLSSGLQAQNMRTSLFEETDAAFASARAADAALLSPQNFANAEKYYARAENNFDRSNSIETIKKELAQTNSYLTAAQEATRLARVTFNDTLKARGAAQAAQSAQLAAEQWDDGEELFQRAAKVLEDGNVKKAQKYSDDALRTYQAAELTAIQGAILNESRRLIAQDKEDKVERYAPVTFAQAEQYVAQATAALEQDRYNTAGPQALARKAEYAARHAAYLADRARDVKDGKQTVEQLILDFEKPLIAVAAELDSPTDMSRGYALVEDGSLVRIRSLQSRLETQDQRVTELEQVLGKTTQVAEASEKRRQQLNSLESLFKGNEARIVREGDKVIIRLNGLQFDSGQAVIQSRYFQLLQKIAEVPDIFPGASLIVEGHTDSVGSEPVNLSLSERRANSVRDYLLASTLLGVSQVNAIGYGKTRPIANNESVEGRSRNRRIDVVIVPAAG